MMKLYFLINSFGSHNQVIVYVAPSEIWSWSQLVCVTI